MICYGPNGGTMIKTILGLATLSSIGAYAGQHSLETGLFYTKHTSDNYKYELNGLAIEYKYRQDTGKNFTVDYYTNFSDKNLYRESQTAFHYTFDLSALTLYPKVASQSIFHKVLRSPDGDYFLHQHWMLGGVGINKAVLSYVVVNAEMLYSFHVGHALTMMQGDLFTGVNNPLHDAYVLRLGLAGNYGDHLHYSVNGNYSRDWKNTYETRGCVLSIEWRF